MKRKGKGKKGKVKRKKRKNLQPDNLNGCSQSWILTLVSIVQFRKYLTMCAICNTKINSFDESLGYYMF